MRYVISETERTEEHIVLSNGCILSVEDEDLIPYILKGLDKKFYVKLRPNPPLWNINAALHRVIMSRIAELNPSLVVDHVNNNKLDNRRSNLKQITQRNNTTKNSKRSKSKYFRIAFNSSRKHWTISFSVDTKAAEYFGYYHDEKEAAYWADVWAVRLLPEGSVLNFPENLEEYLKVAASLTCVRPWQRNLIHPSLSTGR